MKFLLSLLIILLMINTVLPAQCPAGDINLTTQAEIDNFATAYPNCSVYSKADYFLSK